MKSWTRTLNLDDAHTLLAMATPGRDVEGWSADCMDALPDLSHPRRRELVRILRDEYLSLDTEGHLVDDLFLHTYRHAPGVAQIDLVRTQWALTHPLPLQAVDALVGPALDSGEPDIPLDDVERFVAAHLDTPSAESRRKTRTVLLGALEGIGVLTTRGTGQHRSLRAARGRPHPVTFAWLIRRELVERGLDGMLRIEAVESSVPARLFRCGHAHASRCLDHAVARGTLWVVGDEVRAPT